MGRGAKATVHKAGSKICTRKYSGRFFIKEVGSGLRSGSEAIIWIWIRPGRKVPDLIGSGSTTFLYLYHTSTGTVPSSNVRVSPYSKKTKTYRYCRIRSNFLCRSQILFFSCSVIGLVQTCFSSSYCAIILKGKNIISFSTIIV
jgi:hypothetical protein